MTDEEKKAIQYLNKYCDTDLFYEPRHYNYIKMIIRLVGKQQKEIEELVKVSKECIEEKFNNDNMWKDKIKAKIEEYEKALNILLQKDEWIEPSDTIIRNKFMHYIEFGQSLLEKE